MRLTLLACLVGLAAFFVFKRPPPDTGDVDQPRYATLGLNLADHAVFSSEAYAPNANPTSSLAFAGPAIAAELALAARLDQGTKEALICIASASPHCDTRLPLLRLLHLIEILVFLASLWWIGFSILGEEWQAWLVTFIGLGFRELFEFSNVAASEPLYLMTYGLFAGAMVAGYVEHRGGAWWVACGRPFGPNCSHKDGFSEYCCRLFRSTLCSRVCCTSAPRTQHLGHLLFAGTQQSHWSVFGCCAARVCSIL